MRFAILGLVGLMLLGASPVVVADDDDDYYGESRRRNDGNYPAGWTDGYLAGWKYVKGELSIPPIPPIPPLPTDPLRVTRQDGYNDGFVAGMAAAKAK